MATIRDAPQLHIDGTRVRRTPFWDATQRDGCRSYDVYNHTYAPSSFGDPIEEYWQLLRSVAVWDVGAEKVIEVGGPDGHRFMNMLTPRDLHRCRVGGAKYAVLTDERGGIVCDVVVLRLAEHRYWLSTADADVLLWMRGVTVNADMNVEVREAEAWPLQIQGPRAGSVVQSLLGEQPDGWITETRIGDIPVLITRTGDNWSKPAWTGGSYSLFLRDADRGDELWELVMRAGRAFGIRACGPSPHWLVEAGIYTYGADIGLEDNPFEVTGLEDLVEEQSEDYIGKSALERVRATGVSRKLVGVEIDGEPIMQRWSDYRPVRSGEREIGRVTSAVYSPRLDRNVGFAWVPIDSASVGARLIVEAPFGSTGATVAELPFHHAGTDREGP